jgi:uncharacterized protein with NAD-binding domain and iron-sulfur cluster
MASNLFIFFKTFSKRAAGAAGTAAAYSLSKHAEKFKVEVWEKGSVPGGVACSSVVNGDVFVNYGVQGGTPSYRNTLLLMKEYNFEPSPVHMMISFGKGNTHWTNSSACSNYQDILFLVHFIKTCKKYLYNIIIIIFCTALVIYIIRYNDIFFISLNIF